MMMISYILLGLIVLLLVFIVYKVSNPPTSNDNSESLLREINRIETSVKQEIATNRQELNQSAKDSREELSVSLKNFGEVIETKLTRLTETIEAKLKLFQDDSKDGRKEIKQVLD